MLFLACLGGHVGLILEVLGRSWRHLGPSWAWSRQVKQGQVKSGQFKSGQDGLGDLPGTGVRPGLGREGFPRHIRMGLLLWPWLGLGLGLGLRLALWL